MKRTVTTTNVNTAYSTLADPFCRTAGECGSVMIIDLIHDDDSVLTGITADDDLKLS